MALTKWHLGFFVSLEPRPQNMNAILAMPPPGLPSHEIEACMSVIAALSSLVITIALRLRIRNWSASSSNGFRSARAFALLSFALAAYILIRTVLRLSQIGFSGEASWYFEIFTPIIALLICSSSGWALASRFIGRTQTTV